MSELQTLLSQKETLAEQLRRITETCEGIENAANAAKVAALNEEQLKLTAQKRELQTKAASIERTLSDIGGKIQELSGSGIEKLLNAIKNQRWFFFKNKPKIIFDRDTGLLWASLEYFPYIKNYTGYDYYNSNNYQEVKDLINSTNESGIDGYTNWRIPNPFEFWKMIEDKTFPYKEGANWYIKGCRFFCVYYKGIYQCNDLHVNGATVNISTNYHVSVIPCSAEIQPADYENNISQNNTVYTEKEKLQMTLDIFVTNELEPIFTDATITELFRQIYIVKPEVQKKLAELQQQIDALNEVELISPKLDWLALKTKFDVGADSSPIRYALSLKNLTEYLIPKFDEYVKSKSAVINELEKISAPPELLPDVEKVRADLNYFRQDACAIHTELISAKFLRDLHNEYKKDYPPFAFVTEALTEKIRRVLLKVELFEIMPDFVRNASVAVKALSGSAFKDDESLREKIFEFIGYVKEGRFHKKLGESTAAELVLDNLKLFIENCKVNEDIPKQIEILQKNMCEVTERLDDAGERLWVETTLERLGR